MYHHGPYWSAKSRPRLWRQQCGQSLRHQNLSPACRHEGQYLHPGPKHIAHAVGNLGEEAWWSLNTDAHIRSGFIGRSETIPVVGGRMELGEFGRIYFVDFDAMRPRDRTVHFTVMGE